ncbi:TetR family transcriptional regulator [Herbihabitans rhizosphaerae]|uniref:TetR family transcriptional regulator n=1 Tax=Herbihabitans rhizosphaerae TaxID=1872711 RepID=A0A4Q7L3D4_9PSEU|nr:TetR/AcrR family transcriptional regulator [Herbihabitans rhizosphaerae]RZS43240.1 TetR family transcriptional regulator [Herbihabitans rhizosphaerae]
MRTERTDGRLARGRRTREVVLDAAIARASVDGLAGLSLGQLADSLGVSKSGLFSHWPDKEALQLAAIDHARAQWTDLISRPAVRAPRGVRRLFALHEARLSFYASEILPGGCFFHAVQADFDDKPGPVNTRIAEAKSDWLAFIASLAAKAVELGELRADTDPEQLAFEIEALGQCVIAHSRLVDDDSAYTRSRLAVLHRLRELATDPSILPEEQ